MFHFKMYLVWDGSVEPFLSKVDIRNQAAMTRDISQEDTRESDDSIWYNAGTEEKKDDLLKMTPLTQKCYGFFIILHYLNNNTFTQSIK